MAARHARLPASIIGAEENRDNLPGFRAPQLFTAKQDKNGDEDAVEGQGQDQRSLGLKREPLFLGRMASTETPDFLNPLPSNRPRIKGASKER